MVQAEPPHTVTTRNIRKLGAPPIRNERIPPRIYIPCRSQTHTPTPCCTEYLNVNRHYHLPAPCTHALARSPAVVRPRSLIRYLLPTSSVTAAPHLLAPHLIESTPPLHHTYLQGFELAASAKHKLAHAIGSPFAAMKVPALLLVLPS